MHHHASGNELKKALASFHYLRDFSSPERSNWASGSHGPLLTCARNSPAASAAIWYTDVRIIPLREAGTTHCSAPSSEAMPVLPLSFLPSRSGSRNWRTLSVRAPFAARNRLRKSSHVPNQQRNLILGSSSLGGLVSVSNIPTFLPIYNRWSLF